MHGLSGLGATVVLMRIKRELLVVQTHLLSAETWEITSQVDGDTGISAKSKKSKTTW